ncbi:MAG: hypothetical protein ACRC28_10785 [Clostridium sp.]|uniref:hypothetical protein n=1 Tax=Clostridium sp. TaxID=1506 RepID=UPI003F3A9A9A
MVYQGISKKIKGFKNRFTGISQGPESILECFLSSGSVPPWLYAKLNSMMGSLDLKENVIRRDSQQESEERRHSKISHEKTRNYQGKNSQTNIRPYADFEKQIGSLSVTTREKIFKIYNIKMDYDDNNIKEFEELAKANKWTDEDQGQIYSSLIYDEEYKNSLTKNSFKTLKNELKAIKYPKSDAQHLRRSLDSLRQTHYMRIADYDAEITNLLQGYSFIKGLTKKEQGRVHV